jgi:ribosome modulation factor
MDTTTTAALLARCPCSNKAHAGAWRNGLRAALAGQPRTACPYDPRACGGRFGNVPTGERGFANAWLRGYDAGRPGRAEP